VPPGFPHPQARWPAHLSSLPCPILTSFAFGHVPSGQRKERTVRGSQMEGGERTMKVIFDGMRDHMTAPLGILSQSLDWKLESFVISFPLFFG